MITPQTLLQDFNFEFYDQKFVGPYLPETQKAQTGSTCGRPINIDGYLFTNYHVVTGENKIKAALGDGLDLDASEVETDQASDLALPKIKEDGLPFIELGNSDSVAVGGIALIVGNPLTLSSTITQRIISYKTRNIAQSTKSRPRKSYI